jgi:hypothetical protein
MWVLLIVLMAYGNPPSNHFSAQLLSQEFASKNTCEAAKTAVGEVLNEIVDSLNKALSELQQVGQIEGINGTRALLFCLEK